MRVEINNQILSRPYSIEPAEWQNIWVYGTNIYVAGYLPRRELRYLQRRRANSNRNEIESLTGKYFPTVADLHPITNLFH